MASVKTLLPSSTFEKMEISVFVIRVSKDSLDLRATEREGPKLQNVKKRNSSCSFCLLIFSNQLFVGIDASFRTIGLEKFPCFASIFEKTWL